MPTPKTIERPQKAATHSQLIALAYDSDGRMLGRGKVGDQTITFDLERRQLAHSRVYVLPRPPKGDRRFRDPSPADLEQLLSYRPPVRLNQEGQLTFERIPDHLIERWFWNRCCVQGDVHNRLTIDGISYTYPVCNAVVHVCEVDRFDRIIFEIPDEIIDRMRERILDPIPLPRPLPDPPPFARREMPAGFNGATPRPISLEMPRELQMRMAASSNQQFRQLITANANLLRPLLCYFPLFRNYIYRCTEVATAITDAGGRYEACFYYQDSSDAPDVYVWVEYEVDASTTITHRPSIACNTWWDYDHSHDIDIELSDARILPTCEDVLPGLATVVRTIGHSVRPWQIEQGLPATTSVPGNSAFRTVGLTRYATSALNIYGPGLAQQHLRPYTGQFPLYLQFSSGLPTTGVQYFRWSYRRTHDPALSQLINPANLNSGWMHLTPASLGKSYFVDVVNPDGTVDIETRTFPLGPQTVNGVQLYGIPPSNTALQALTGEPTARWKHDYTHTGTVDTTDLAGDGLYELRLEMYNSAGNLADTPKGFFRMEDPTDVSTTTQMADPFLRQQTDGDDFTFHLRLRVDTEPVTGDIFAVQLNGAEVMTDCGFVEYNPASPGNVSLHFSAQHPRGFGLFGFNVERGRATTAGPPWLPGDTRGMVTGSSTTPSPYTLAGGQYSHSIPVTDMLAGCGGKAAFSEVLTLVGLHTDGHHAGNFYRSSRHNAFALAPQEITRS